MLKAVVDTVLSGAVTRVRWYDTRFTGVFYPGETLRIRIWTEDSQVRVLATAVERDDAPSSPRRSLPTPRYSQAENPT